MGQQHFAVVDDLAYHGDVANGHRTAGGERQNSAFARLMATVITTLGLSPPSVGVAVDFDTGDLPRIRRALENASGGRGHDQGAERKHGSRDKCAKSTDHV